MITKEKLLELIRVGEQSGYVQFTDRYSTNLHEKIQKAICAFSNDFGNRQAPSYFLIGVKDDGQLAGFKSDENIQNTIAGFQNQGSIEPRPAFYVGAHNFPEGDVIYIEVQPSSLPPIKYDGRVWICNGASVRQTNPEQERVLSERRSSQLRQSFDASPCLGSQLSDLSLDLFTHYRHQAIHPEVIAANGRSIEEQLAALQFYDLLKQCPTYAGILLFGKNPRYWLPGAYVQFLKLEGNELSSDKVVKEEEIGGDLKTVIEKLLILIEIYINKRPVFVDSFREEMKSTYPLIALRELIFNAILHRDYDANTPIRFYWYQDFIEIGNAGSLYGKVSKDNFRSVNDYRNPILATAMKELGYVNKFGSGVGTAERALEQNGNLPCEFRFDEGYTSVKIHGKTI